MKGGRGILSVVVLVCVCEVLSASSLFFQRNDNVEQAVGEDKDVKTYYFVGDGKNKPYAFLNELGVLVGFDVDVVNAVCKQAGKKCFYTLAKDTECIFTDRNLDYAGAGLQSRWFDACPGYTITTDRKNNFDFTLPYLESSCSFSVMEKNPAKFDPNNADYSKFKLLHLNGAPSNAQCLTRLGKKFDKILVANSMEEAETMMKNGDADVLFSTTTVLPGMEMLSTVSCSHHGAGIMVNKGSKLPIWWNMAFQQLYFSGEFHKLCRVAEDKYGAKPACVRAPKDADKELLSVMRNVPALSRAEQNERLWKFVVSGRVAPYSYLNKEGVLVGFTRDMITEVCKRADKKCHLLTAQVKECTTGMGDLTYPGRGMNEGWFDGCTGYFNTYERSNSYDFTTPYLVSTSSFKVAPGNPTKFDPSADDYSPWTIVHAETAITNAHCLNRLHKKFGKIIIAKDVLEAQDMVLAGKADAWFTKYREPIKLEGLPEQFHCGYVGTSIMVKKGSEVPSWWNPAFTEFYQSGGFNQFCMDQEKKHPGVKFPCLPPPKSRPEEGF